MAQKMNGKRSFPIFVRNRKSMSSLQLPFQPELLNDFLICLGPSHSFPFSERIMMKAIQPIFSHCKFTIPRKLFQVNDKPVFLFKRIIGFLKIVGQKLQLIFGAGSQQTVPATRF